MSYKSTYENGSWLAICDVCGVKVKASLLCKRWDGLMVDWRCYEERQPQDFVRGVADKIVPPWTRPEQQDTFVFFCTLTTQQGVADYGTADCAQADISNGYRPTCTVWGSLAIAGDAVAGCAVSGLTSPPLNSFLFNNS